MRNTEALKPFYLDIYLSEQKQKRRSFKGNKLDLNTKFALLCDKVKNYIDQEFDNEHKNASDSSRLIERQKKAILGYPSEVNYFKDKINEYLRLNNLQGEDYPRYYKNLTDAIFHENWGLAGIAPWMDMKNSTSAKIIGDRIYFFEDGKMILQEQRISRERFEKLRSTLLLGEPDKKMGDNYSEVYMLTGERVTIYTGNLTIKNQEVMVFRKYVVESLTFEEQARLGTIPEELIPALKALVAIGVNVAFVGAPRGGKTTLLLTWQTYEDPTLEGVFVQTDAEIRIHEVMPNAPITSIIADDEQLDDLAKKLVRSDANYLVVPEGRNAHAYQLIVETCNKGLRRNKTSMHLTFPEHFCQALAMKITSQFGGNLDYTINEIAASFHYIFELIELPENRAKKRLNAIYELRFNEGDYSISYHKICEYNRKTDSWTFAYDIGERIKEIGRFENENAYKIFDSTLKTLAQKYPMEHDNVIIPFYSKKRGE